jgi:hypothetical protein
MAEEVPQIQALVRTAGEATALAELTAWGLRAPAAAVWLAYAGMRTTGARSCDYSDRSWSVPVWCIAGRERRTDTDTHRDRDRILRLPMSELLPTTTVLRAQLRERLLRAAAVLADGQWAAVDALALTRNTVTDVLVVIDTVTTSPVLAPTWPA